MIPQENSEAYRVAEQRVGRKTSFYRTLAAYVIVSISLWAVAFLTNGGWWPAWVMLGWGIGLAWQAYDAFGLRNTEYDRRRMIEEEMRRSREK